MRKILLDTNAYASLAGGDDAVLEALGEADVTFVSIFVLGELYAGFRGGKFESKNRAALREFLASPTVKLLFATDDTAEVFGGVKDALRRQGTPIPINDVWIAAHAMEAGAALVTFDAHFEHVKGLRRWPSR
ncbi:MAG: type II toxin-antitoxin system VapC family toxin [Myxococcales bacterium]|nr:type II toxin-antitoxin system VapC family toxin [Myxococcales bacterium]